MKLSQNKDINKLLKSAHDCGANIEHGGRHVIVRFFGSTVVISATPSDSHAFRNARADLRRIGLPL